MNAYELAKIELGTAEITGPKHNAKVVQYFADAGNAGVRDDETAWCAAFVGAMIERSGVRSTRALNARSYLDWGEPVDIAAAVPGDIAVFKRGNSSWQGHVAFYMEHTPAKVRVLGGNQSDKVSVADYAMADLLGIRRAQRPAKAPVAPSGTATPKQPATARNGRRWLTVLVAILRAIFGKKGT